MLFVSSGDGRSYLADIATGNVERTYKSDPVVGHGVSFSTSTELIVLPQQRAPCIFLFSSGMAQPVHKCFTSERIAATAVSPCGLYVVGGSGESGCMFIWNAKSGQLLRLVKGHLRKINQICFSPCGQYFASASADSCCKVWSMSSILGAAQTSSVLKPLTNFTAHTLSVNSVCFFGTGMLVATTSNDRSVKVFDAFKGVTMHTTHLEQPGTCVAVAKNDNTLVVGGPSGLLTFVTLQEFDTQCRLPLAMPSSASRGKESILRHPFEDGHNGAISSIMPFGVDGSSVLVASMDGIILQWSLETHQVEKEIMRVKKGISNAFIVPLAVGCVADQNFQAKTDKRVAPLAKHPANVDGGDYTVPVSMIVAETLLRLNGDVEEEEEDGDEGGRGSTEKKKMDAMEDDAINIPALVLPKYNKAKQRRAIEAHEKLVKEAKSKKRARTEKEKKEVKELEEVEAENTRLEQVLERLVKKLDKKKKKKMDA